MFYVILCVTNIKMRLLLRKSDVWAATLPVERSVISFSNKLELLYVYHLICNPFFFSLLLITL